MHVPNEDKKSLSAVLSYVATLRLDYCIILGDLMDFNCISSFVQGSPGEIENQRVFNDYWEGSKVLTKIEKAVRRKNKRCQIFYIEGNHEDRVERWMNRYPQLKGILEVETNLALSDRDIKWVPFWRNKRKNVVKIGKAVFIHGEAVNKYHAFTHVDRFWGQLVFYGHTHDIQEFSKSFKGHDGTVRGKSMGCLCNYSQTYLKGKTTKWQQGFGIFYHFPDGRIQDITIPIYKHRFVGLNGKVYGET